MSKRQNDTVEINPPYIAPPMSLRSPLVKYNWMDDLQFYVLFNNVSVISEQWEVDNERLCAVELRLQVSRFRLEQGSNSVSRPALNPLSYWGSTY